MDKFEVSIFNFEFLNHCQNRCLSKKIPGCEANAASDLANSLIAQAKDEANLATMYEGWTSWI